MFQPWKQSETGTPRLPAWTGDPGVEEEEEEEVQLVINRRVSAPFMMVDHLEPGPLRPACFSSCWSGLILAFPAGSSKLLLLQVLLEAAGSSPESSALMSLPPFWAQILLDGPHTVYILLL